MRARAFEAPATVYGALAFGGCLEGVDIYFIQFVSVGDWVNGEGKGRVTDKLW